MDVLVIDVGGTNVKTLATGQQEPIKFPSGPEMTAKAMVANYVGVCWSVLVVYSVVPSRWKERKKP